MANVMKSLATKTQGFLKWFKAPWQITGPTSGQEYKNAIWDANGYRLHAPASPTVQACVPHAQPQHVLDIKYHTRDRRRQYFERTREEVDPHVLPQDVAAVQPTSAVSAYYVMGQVVHLNDAPGDGYQR